MDELNEIRNQIGAATDLAQIIQSEVDKQLAAKTSEVMEGVKKSNLDYLDILSEELDKIRQESQTFQGAIERLQEAVAPRIDPTEDDVTNFITAINNLERYGAIIPSSGDKEAYLIREAKRKAWGIACQSFIRLALGTIATLLKNK